MNRIFNTEFPARYADLFLLLFRVAASAFMWTHGIPKLLKLASGSEIQFADPYGLGPVFSFALVIFAEFFCSFLVILGFATRLAVIPLMFTMMTAVIYAHAHDPFSVKEKPLLFFLVFAALFVFGPGRYSVDGMLNKRSR
jgi:putative oxidoreductase